MALYTVGTPTTGTTKSAFRHTNVSITDQTAASTAVSNAIPVPDWAGSCSFYLYINSMGGTNPTLDFTFLVPKMVPIGPPTVMASTMKLGNAGLSITQITAAAQVDIITVDIGPGVTTDTTGSATASCYYALNTYLPPWIVTTYTTSDSADDADYDFDICVYFRP